ncbi:anti sigma factor C-terminal domain-containing protein [Thermoanaerobacterium sp. RBIITD]|uniref:anti sigma factor C-terminal domain-containing protein n=1 Tax=Thermoanaerobacterium sp. RBIITD TaxID=1550240 RepID=UPI000BB6C43C|nr:anti sigma factor C-terminal domain-containing protein [Thermoanaerobacterium sp. RBIITD]SNX54837.1 Sigma factor regulator N-terminal [Thermoanaerobacterium sp. RBIITD]
MADEKKINGNGNNDEKDLDDIFESTKKDKFEKAVKRAKWRSILRTIVISLIVIGIVSISSIFIGNKVTQSESSLIDEALSLFNIISAPDMYMGKSIRYEGIFGGKTVYSTYKIIEGKVVYTGQQEYSYGLFNTVDVQAINSPAIVFGKSFDEDSLNKPTYNELGQREMIFFYPYVKYKTYKNDLNLLEDIGNDKYIEMALSFDKEYSIDEVNNMMPKNVTLTWYWIDDLNSKEKEAHKPRENIQKLPNGKSIVVDNPADVCSEKAAYGIKVYDSNGDLIKNPEEFFIGVLENNIKDIEKLKTDNHKVNGIKSEVKRIYDNLKDKDGKIKKENIKIQGVVVTGTAETLKSLRGLPFIKASSLGVVTDKY